MKILNVVTAPCRCQDKAEELRLTNQRADLPAWAPGTVVECDCGRRLRLAEHQRDGLYWSFIVTRDGS